MRFALLALALVLSSGCSSDREPSSSDGAVPPSPTETEQPGEASLFPFDTPPEPVETVAPEYPETARASLSQGMVRVEVTVDEKGEVEEARLVRSSGHGSLDQAALEAARGWRFRPARIEERPVRSKIVIPFDFKLS